MLEDQLRPNAKQSIEAIEQILGNDHVMMLSGDCQKTAEAFGRRAGITRVYGDLMPGDKAYFVEQYQQKGMRVGVLGDGINDAPALAKALPPLVRCVRCSGFRF